MVKVNKEAYIPLLPYDLGYEETILQMIKSLDCLDKVVECVYGHVRDNINGQKSEIVKLNDKLNDVVDKVRRLSNTNKSVQVHSSSKYPATHCQKDYEYSYDFNVKSNIVDNITVAHQICVTRDPLDKLKFYNVNDEKKEISINKDVCKVKGLGDLPDDVKYINSLLLFNSNENLYKNYVISNPYKANVTTTTTSKRVDDVENINNKPVFTLPLDDTENQFNYSYTPMNEEVPIIDVPADLPDLPGIMGDVQLFKEEKENVVDNPVICQPFSVVDLPNFNELDNLQNDKVLVDESTISIVPQDILAPEPEQSTLTTVVSDQNKIDHNKDNNSSIKNEQNISKTYEQNINKMYDNNINTHSVLMDEIRNAGGLKKAKLRPVNDRKTNDAIVPAGDGLMADLHKKLAMRRQGISGNNKHNNDGLGGVIYRMASTMLPPDPESESETDRNDDDTENDWDD